jgi:hypothetical protein
MSHLTPADIVDAAEGRVSAAAAAHLAGCTACQALAADIRSAWDAAAEVSVPEPSPLYWQHLSARVREQVAGETVVPAWRATPWREYFSLRNLMPIASAVVLVAAVIGTGLLTRPGKVRGDAAIIGSVPNEVVFEPDNSEVWDALTSAAADARFDDAHEAGFAVSSSAVDHAVQRMTPEELTELSRLLQSELGAAGR